MTLNVSYMGTKKMLAPDVAEVVSACVAGPMLDLFAGMCSVAETVSVERPVWCNDIQTFAAQTAMAFFTSRWEMPDESSIVPLILPRYERNRDALNRRFKSILEREVHSFNTGDADVIKRVEGTIPHVQTSTLLERERVKLSQAGAFPYRLFSITYGGSYFGLSQCIEIDSIRFALDDLVRAGGISYDQRRWMLLALCQAMSKVSTTTGHFAQPMTVKPLTTARYLAQRRRSIFTEWVRAQGDCRPVGTAARRKANRVFQKDAIALLRDLLAAATLPAVVYADPPYTADQYSRYYHIYETLFRYDYPISTGIGRYRGDRFVSPFSCSSKVVSAIDDLASSCARLGTSLVLSYPSEGLVENSMWNIPAILRRHFAHVEVAVRKQHRHSSMGAANGIQGRRVTEIIYLAE